LPRHAPNSAGASFFTGDGNQQLSPGTAQTLSIGELGGAFSGLGLELCGLATAALMPLINRLLWQALRGLHFAEKTRGTQDGADHWSGASTMERRRLLPPPDRFSMMTALAETRLHHVNTGRMESSEEHPVIYRRTVPTRRRAW